MISDSGEEPGAHAVHKGGIGVVLICLGTMVAFNTIGISLAPGLPTIARELGAGSDGTLVAQLVLTIPGIAMILGAALVGFLSQRFGRRWVMMSFHGLYAIVGFAGIFADTLPELVASRVVAGFAAGGLLTTVYATVGEYFEGIGRHKMIGFVSMTSSAWTVILLPLSGAIVDEFGWRATFWLYLPGLLLIAVARLGMHGEKPPSAGVDLSWRPILALWPIVLLVVIYTIGVYMMVIQGPFLAEARGEASGTLIGTLIAVTSAVGAAGGGIYGYLRRWLGFRAMFAFISFVFGIGMIVAVTAPSMTIFVLAFAIMGLGSGIVEPTAATEALNRTPDALHDRAAGATIAGLFLGQFLNPWVMNPLRESGGIGFAFSVVAVAWLVGAALFLLACFAQPAKAFPAWVRTRAAEGD